MLCYTGGTHFSAGLIDKQEQLYRQGSQETIEGLRGLQRLAYEMKDALLTGDLWSFGDVLGVSWEQKRRMNPEVTNERIDEMYAAARKNGALGGKLLGAGGGGYLLLFSPLGHKRTIREKLERLGGQFTDFAFVEEGLQTWRSNCL